MIYYFKALSISSINFIKFKGPFGFFEKIKNGNISIKKQWKKKINLNQI